ncbi:MAG: DNA polymerase III subunit delta' [Brachymonas sp.]|nr:DNA polymerase III subunit delta' [Brachymonas sp.]
MNNTPATSLALWLQRQATALLQQRGHAWLLQGPSGLGQWDLALTLAQAWLCEQPQDNALPCGQCPSCHGIAARTHADVCVLMPEVQMLALGWPLDEKTQKDLDDKKRKPSKEIRIEGMRAAVEFSQRTSSRNRGKVVLVYPAERMNAITANALLKTLEEPPGDTRFVLASEAAHALLPTIRSRCLGHVMHWPETAEALTWLQGQGMDATQAPVLLAAAGGRPQDALDLAQSGVDAARWQQLPRAAAAGHTEAFAACTPAQLIGILQKICHDLLALKAGAQPRFFDADSLPAVPALPSVRKLSQWNQALVQAARTCEHPYAQALFVEDLLTQARSALAATAPHKKPEFANFG